MFTKNWYKAIAYNTLNNFIEASTNMQGGVNRVSSYGWQNLALFYNEDKVYTPSLYYLRTSVTGNGGVILGTGTTPPTLDDYCLSGDMITTFSYTSSVTKEEDESGVTLTAVYTINNTGSEEFTVGEIGLMASYSTATQISYKLLFERTVLETPVTIPAGGVGQITYTIKLVYPTD